MLQPTIDVYPGESLFPGIVLRCRSCDATIGQIESDIAALDGLKSQVIAKIQSILAPGEHVERVKLSQFFTETFESKQEIDDAVERLREYLLKLLDEGVKIILE